MYCYACRSANIKIVMQKPAYVMKQIRLLALMDLAAFLAAIEWV